MPRKSNKEPENTHTTEQTPVDDLLEQLVKMLCPPDVLPPYLASTVDTLRKMWNFQKSGQPVIPVVIGRKARGSDSPLLMVFSPGRAMGTSARNVRLEELSPFNEAEVRWLLENRLTFNDRAALFFYLKSLD